MARGSVERADRMIRRVVVDGNDGTGKSTVIAILRSLDHTIEFCDRGLPTQMTDDKTILPADDEFYVILDAPIAVSQDRLRKAGKSLEERYHTYDDLVWYRSRFRDIGAKLKNAVLIDASGDPKQVVKKILRELMKRDII